MFDDQNLAPWDTDAGLSSNALRAPDAGSNQKCLLARTLGGPLWAFLSGDSAMATKDLVIFRFGAQMTMSNWSPDQLTVAAHPARGELRDAAAEALAVFPVAARAPTYPRCARRGP